MTATAHTPVHPSLNVARAQKKLPPLIQSFDGIVCSACRLWPDLCTCDPEHPVHEIIRAVFRT